MPESSVIWQGGLYGNTSLPAGVQGDGGIPSVGLNHEGNYTCEVYYGAWRLAVVVAVEFLVVGKLWEGLTASEVGTGSAFT